MGDHGEGMKRGCEALIKILETENYVYVDELCRAVSIELIKTMGGASGIYFWNDVSWRYFKFGTSGICNSTTDCRLFLEWGTGD